MKRALILAFLLLVGAPVTFVAAGRQVDSQKENIVITESTLYGDPHLAEGLRLKMASIDSQLEGHLIWDTAYDMGSGEAKSSFVFSSRGEDWLTPRDDEISMDGVSSWGTVKAGPDGHSVPFQPENHRMSEVVKAVMERTEAGERRTETVRLIDYYEYDHSFTFKVNSDVHDVHYDDDIYSSFFDVRYSGVVDSQGYFNDYFRIPVSGGELWEVTLEKDEAGEVINVQCVCLMGFDIENVQAFGGEGVYHTYSLRPYVRADFLEENPGMVVWTDRETAEPGENYGIYYYPYTEAPVGYRFLGSLTVDPTQARKVCDLEPGIRLEDMALNEAENRLYLVTGEDEDIFLRVYEVGETVVSLKQKLFVCSDTEERNGEGVSTDMYCRLSVQEEGVLMTWSDGSFAFAACVGENLKLWSRKQESVFGPVTFRNEYFWDFDGERLVLASFVDNQRAGINLAVYTEDGLAWLGLCEHSEEMYKEIRGIEWE